MADTDKLIKRNRSVVAKKVIRKYGKDFYRLIGLKGTEKRKVEMLKRVRASL